MKNLLRTITLLGATIFVFGGSASAQISNTGPGSNNTITDTTTNACTSATSNNIDVSNTTTQSSSNGDASVDGNTTGGGATSGASSNSNSSTTTIVSTNSSPCLPVAVTTEQPSNPGKGGEVLGETVAAPAATQPVVASLPNTASNIGTANAAAATSAAISGLVLLAYVVRAWQAKGSNS